MTAPSIRVNGGTAGVKASVSATTAVTAALDSTDGIRSCAWSVIGTDETSAVGSYTLVQSGSVGQSVAFTSLGAGTAMILRVIVNGGIDLQTGLADASGTSATVKVYVPTASGYEVGAAGERYESNATTGATGIVNAGVRAIDAVSPGGIPVKIVRVATTAALPANTRSGNVLTADANGAFAAIDGVTLSAGEAFLAQNEGGGASHVNNGAYTLTTVGDGSTPWTATRAVYWDASSELVKGTVFRIQDGTTYGGKERIYRTSGATINVTAQEFGADGYAPATAQYLCATADANLSAEVAIDAITSTVNFTSTSVTPLGAYRTDSATNATVDAFKVTAMSSGTAAAGFGVSCLFQGELGGAAENYGRFGFAATDVSGGSEDTKAVIQTRTAGAALATAAEFSGTAATVAALSGVGTRAVTADASGVLGTTGLASATANYLEDTATAVTTNGRPIQNLAAQLSFLRAAEAPVKLTHQTAAAGSVVEGLRVRQFIAASGVGTGTEGVRVAFSLPNGSGTETVSGTFRSEWTTVIGGGNGKFVWATALAGSLNDRMELNSTGVLTLNAYTTAGMLTNSGSGVFSSTSPILLIHGAVPANLTNAVDTRAMAGAVLFQADGTEGVTSSTTDATDSTVLDGLCVQRVPDSGIGAIGIGTGIVIRTLDDGGGQIDIGRLTWTTTNVASATAVMGFCVASAGGLPEVATLSDAGTLTTDGVMQTDAGFDAATATTLPIGGRATRIDLLSDVAAGGTGAGIRLHNDAGIRTAGYLAEFGDDSTFAFKAGVDYRGVYDGPQLWATALKTSGYTAAAWDQVLCDPTGGGFQVTIPNGTTALKGRRIGVKNYGTSTNTITLDTSTPNGIQGGTATITTGWGYVEIECVGADGWIIVSRVT